MSKLVKNIKDNDLVSGSEYRKFLEAYRDYDKRQKEYIETLERKLAYSRDLMEFEKYRREEDIEEYKLKYEELRDLVLDTGEIGELMIKIINQRKTISELQEVCRKRNEKIKEQRLENQKLQMEITKLKSELSSLQ